MTHDIEIVNKKRYFFWSFPCKEILEHSLVGCVRTFEKKRAYANHHNMGVFEYKVNRNGDWTEIRRVNGSAKTISAEEDMAVIASKIEYIPKRKQTRSKYAH